LKRSTRALLARGSLRSAAALVGHPATRVQPPCPGREARVLLPWPPGPYKVRPSRPGQQPHARPLLVHAAPAPPASPYRASLTWPDGVEVLQFVRGPGDSIPPAHRRCALGRRHN
jgi:hypothetical protein